MTCSLYSPPYWSIDRDRDRVGLEASRPSGLLCDTDAKSESDPSPSPSPLLRSGEFEMGETRQRESQHESETVNAEMETRGVLVTSCIHRDAVQVCPSLSKSVVHRRVFSRARVDKRDRFDG